MSVTITGTAARPAWYSVAPCDGRARLHVDVNTGDARHTIARAVWLVGQGPAAQIAASNAAHHLRSGRRVTVYGAGLALDGGHLVVCGCTGIQQHDATAPRGEESTPA